MSDIRRVSAPLLSLGLALIAGSLWGGSAAAAELDEHTARLLVVAPAADGAAPQSFELDELSEGQAQQFITDAGTKVVVTRTADGYEVDIDGDKSSVKLALPEVEPGAGETSGPHTRVIVHKERHEGDSAAAQAYAFVVTDDANREAVVTELSQVLVGGDGETNVLVTPGDGKHVRVVRVLGDHHGASAADGKAEKIVIIERKTENKPAAGDDQN